MTAPTDYGALVDEFVIPATEGRATVVRKGQILRIHQVGEGRQVGDCTFYNANDLRETFHVGQSWAINGILGTGTSKSFKHFYSKPPRENVMLTVVEDTCRNHWGNMGGRCSTRLYELRDVTEQVDRLTTDGRQEDRQIAACDQIGIHAAGLLEQHASQVAFIDAKALRNAWQVPSGLDCRLGHHTLASLAQNASIRLQTTRRESRCYLWQDQMRRGNRNRGAHVAAGYQMVSKHLTDQRSKITEMLDPGEIPPEAHSAIPASSVGTASNPPPRLRDA